MIDPQTLSPLPRSPVWKTATNTLHTHARTHTPQECVNSGESSKLVFNHLLSKNKDVHTKHFSSQSTLHTLPVTSFCLFVLVWCGRERIGRCVCVCVEKASYQNKRSLFSFYPENQTPPLFFFFTKFDTCRKVRSNMNDERRWLIIALSERVAAHFTCNANDEKQPAN